MCAIGMVNLPFVTNLKFSRAVERKNILKLPRPTLLLIIIIRGRYFLTVLNI